MEAFRRDKHGSRKDEQAVIRGLEKPRRDQPPKPEKPPVPQQPPYAYDPPVVKAPKVKLERHSHQGPGHHG